MDYIGIGEMIRKGGVYKDVPGSTTDEIYQNISKIVNLPDGMTSEQLYNALCAREHVLSTAVGNGISVKDVHHRTYPAIQALSAKFWTGKHVTMPFDEFNYKRQFVREAPGVNELGILPHWF